MDVILARYAEVGLKSSGVRRYFESILMDNMLTALSAHNLEALVTCEQGRIYITTDRIDEAVPILRRVFGIASVSPALISDSAMEAMQRTAAEYSQKVLLDGQSFAVKARREGNHPYKSMDVGREVGSAIFLANEDRGARVNLTRPDVTFYVEVRERRAYIFSEYLSGPAGLPMGSQGKVAAAVETERDALAAWMLMKRGCRVFVAAPSEDGPAAILKSWDPRLKVFVGKDVQKVLHDVKGLATVHGYGVGDIDRIRELSSRWPAFFPLIGMTDAEVEERLAAIRSA
ncbi:MAG: THUMP domain-containing protein [Methanomassiliicoccus sp.]|nr:THUMP domain-containing protein [Methanomassiliicoccus sp.]